MCVLQMIVMLSDSISRPCLFTYPQPLKPCALYFALGSAGQIPEAHPLIKLSSSTATECKPFLILHAPKLTRRYLPEALLKTWRP